MKKNKQHYLSLPYKMEIEPVVKEYGGGYLARYTLRGLNGIMGDGESEVEAIQNAKEAFGCYLDIAIQKGDFIPEPDYEEKTKRINITLSEKLINMIDKRYSNRSAFLSAAATKMLNAQ